MFLINLFAYTAFVDWLSLFQLKPSTHNTIHQEKRYIFSFEIIIYITKDVNSFKKVSWPDFQSSDHFRYLYAKHIQFVILMNVQ